MTDLREAIFDWLGQPVGRKTMDPYWKLNYATETVLILHGPTESMTYPPRDVEAYDKDGKSLGVTVQVPGDPIPGIFCSHCGTPMPCSTIEVIAKGLGIEL